MNRKNQILSLILVIQIVIGAVVLWPQPAPAGESTALFPEVGIDDIVSLHIEENIQADENKIVALAKSGDSWALPNADDFPVDEAQIGPVLEKIAALATGRLVARNDTSHTQLQVADDDFMRRVDFELANGESHTLFVGSSSNPRATHVRNGDQDEVYLTDELTAFDLNGSVGSWIDALYLSIEQASIAEITIENNETILSFVKTGDEWTFGDMGEGETFNSDNVNAMLGTLSNLRMTEPLGEEAKPEYGMDNLTAVVTLLSRTSVEEADSAEGDTGAETNTDEAVEAVEERIYTIQIGAKEEASDSYVVKSSESPYYVRVNSFSLNSVLDKSREEFLIPTPTPAPTLVPEPTVTPDPGAAVETEESQAVETEAEESETEETPTAETGE